MVHVCNPSTQTAGTEISEFKSSLDPVSKKRKNDDTEKYYWHENISIKLKKMENFQV
jgi:hypothetical protein